MHPTNRIVLALATAAALFVALCEPADARRRFRLPFGGGGSGFSEKIDKVYDLPDREPYFHEGKYWDVGYFHRDNSVLGVTTSSTGGSYVLYNGDRYVALDDAGIAMITEDIGTDPVAQHRAGIKAADTTRHGTGTTIERRSGESPAEFRERARALAAAESAKHPATEPSGTPTALGSVLVTGLLMLVLLFFAARKLLFRRPAATPMDADGGPMGGSFEERVAERLRALEAERRTPAFVPAAAVAAPAPGPMGLAPGVRTFGRRVV